MAGQKYYWLKLKEDFFDDKVILKYDGIFPTCEEELAILLDEPLTLVAGVINALEKMGVVERRENDVLYLNDIQELR